LIVHQLTQDRDVDFDLLARTLVRLLAGRAPGAAGDCVEHVVRAVVLLLGCSRAVAEQHVTALLFRRQLVLYTDARGRRVWRFRRPPASC
jgi:hypothetical protein